MYSSSDSIPDVPQRIVQIRLRAAVSRQAHRAANIDDVDGGDLVTHSSRAVSVGWC